MRIEKIIVESKVLQKKGIAKIQQLTSPFNVYPQVPVNQTPKLDKMKNNKAEPNIPIHLILRFA